MVNRTFCSLSGVHRISLVRHCEETSRTVFYSALESQRGCWLLRRPKCRHLILSSVAPPRLPPCAVPTRMHLSHAIFSVGFYFSEVRREFSTLRCSYFSILSCRRHVSRARTRRARGASCAHMQRASRRAEQRVSRRTEQRVFGRAERRVFRRADGTSLRRA